MVHKTILKIKGMHCASCSALIEMALKNEKGIKSGNVNLATEKAYVEYDPEKITLEEVKKAIEKTGYKVEGDDDDMEGMGGMQGMKGHEHGKMTKEKEIAMLDIQVQKLNREIERLQPLRDEMVMLRQEKQVIERQMSELKHASALLEERAIKILEKEHELSVRERGIFNKEEELGEVASKTVFMFRKSAELANYPVPNGFRE